MQTELTLALHKQCEDFVKGDKVASADLLCNLIAAHGAIALAGGLNPDKFDAQVLDWINDVHSTCAEILSDCRTAD